MAALAARQHGVVARRQLLELGFGARAIDHRVKRGRLHVQHRGVYAVGHRAVSRDARWMAAVLAAGPGAALSHRSAAALLGVRASAQPLVDVTVARTLRGRPGLRVHRALLEADELGTHRQIPTTTPTRTLFDLAAVLDRHRLERAIDRAELLRLTSPLSLAALVARHPHARGVAKLRRILASDRIGQTETRSELEDRFLALVFDAGLPRPHMNRRHGRIHPDAVWETARLIVELDGYETHGTRGAFERDRARDRRLVVAGWRVIRVTWRQLHDEPHTIAQQLAALLAYRASASTIRGNTSRALSRPKNTSMCV